MTSPTVDFNPNRKPYLIDGEVISFTALDVAFVWPSSNLTTELKDCLAKGTSPASLSASLQNLLLSREVLRSPAKADPFQRFSIDEQRVVRGLSLSKLDNLPKRGALLFQGDAKGGFWAPTSSTLTLPCPRCLVDRYLAGRNAHPKLYRALQLGHEILFETTRSTSHIQQAIEKPGSSVAVFGKVTATVAEVLPVPGCPICKPLKKSYTSAALTPSPLSLLRRELHKPPLVSVALPQMLWLCGETTVGGGAAWGPDPDLTTRKARHEALERYAAHFPPQDTTEQGVVLQNHRGELRRFPLKKVLLTAPGSVSTGLACRSRLEDALKDATREVCERDALARYWLRQSRGLPAGKLLARCRFEELEITLLQLSSQGWPTVLAMGQKKGRGWVFGSACHDLDLAKAKAVQECRHNATSLSGFTDSKFVEQPSTFAEHALYYWCRPDRFPTVAFESEVELGQTPRDLWWVELTPPDLALLGLRAVRVVAPKLLYTPMSHCDWEDLLPEGVFPPVLPHPFA